MDSKFRTMPYVSISIEGLEILAAYHTEAEIGRIFLAIANYYRNGIQPYVLTEYERKGYNTLMRYTNVEADEWVEKNKK